MEVAVGAHGEQIAPFHSLHIIDGVFDFAEFSDHAFVLRAEVR